MRWLVLTWCMMLQGDADGAEGLKIADDMCKRALAVEVFLSPLASSTLFPVPSTLFPVLTWRIVLPGC